MAWTVAKVEGMRLSRRKTLATIVSAALFDPQGRRRPEDALDGRKRASYVIAQLGEVLGIVGVAAAP